MLSRVSNLLKVPYVLKTSLSMTSNESDIPSILPLLFARVRRTDRVSVQSTPPSVIRSHRMIIIITIRHSIWSVGLLFQDSRPSTSLTIGFFRSRKSLNTKERREKNLWKINRYITKNLDCVSFEMMANAFMTGVRVFWQMKRHTTVYWSRRANQFCLFKFPPTSKKKNPIVYQRPPSLEQRPSRACVCVRERESLKVESGTIPPFSWQFGVCPSNRCGFFSLPGFFFSSFSLLIFTLSDPRVRFSLSVRRFRMI